jgi:hypothetical protein
MFYFENDAKPEPTSRPPNQALPLIALASESHEPKNKSGDKPYEH